MFSLHRICYCLGVVRASLLHVKDRVVDVFLRILERHEAVAIRAESCAAAIAKDEVPAAGKLACCFVADQIDRMTVEDSVSRRSLHELDSTDRLCLKVIRPTNSYSNGPADFQLGLD